MSTANTAAIPMKAIGPVAIHLSSGLEQLKVPLATFETTLWPSTNRGAKISRLCGGIKTYCQNACMTRSVVVAAPDAQSAIDIAAKLPNQIDTLQQVVSTTSSHARLQAVYPEVVGRLLYLRFSFHTGDAAGHNMTTKAADSLLNWLLERHPGLEYRSISANICVDKKTSASNGILGRGKHVIAEMVIPRQICQRHLKTTPEAICQLNETKNLIGGVLAGSLRSANAHFANLLLATYLATGQDAANIIEGSQGITYAEVVEQGLYFSVKCPNIIVGTIGNGKDLAFVHDNLQTLGCTEPRASGDNSKRLARIIAATVLCGELSLMAAQTNPGELTRSHMLFERR